MTDVITTSQIEPILDDFLGVDCPHYEELRKRCAQRIVDLYANSRPASEWRDISTAPRDGTWFMICRDEDGPDSYEVGKWAPYYTKEYHETEPGSNIYRAVMVEPTYGWRGFNNMHRATHWRPVPAPPQRNEVTKPNLDEPRG